MGFGIILIVGRSAAEPRLDTKGLASELNLDDKGMLWISDYKIGEVWGIDPASGAYKVYAVSGSPIDARQADGWLWWADGLSNLIGQVSTNDGSFTHWQVLDAFGFLGTSLDAQGRLYATDSSNPYLYRLDPGESSLCTYTLPGFGASKYIIRDGEYLWLDDSFDSTILRLQTNNDSLTWWALPEASSPFGMVVDAQGNLWFADQGTNMLAQLNPTTNQLISYALPIGDYPQMIAIQSGSIWYTEQSLPSFGRLDPITADHTMVSLTVYDQQLTPSCNSISPSGSGKIRITSGKLSWGNKTYTLIVNAAGWQIYQLPKTSDPWGIALADFGYVVDSGRQVMIRFIPTLEPIPILSTTGTVTSLGTLTGEQSPPPTVTPTETLQPNYFRTYLPITARDGSGTP